MNVIQLTAYYQRSAARARDNAKRFRTWRAAQKHFAGKKDGMTLARLAWESSKAWLGFARRNQAAAEAMIKHGYFKRNGKIYVAFPHEPSADFAERELTSYVGKSLPLP
jgi:hypothetical protein